MAKSIVQLPVAVCEPYEVFINGVPQREGHDFQVKGRTLMFDRELRKDRISKRRWSLAPGVLAPTDRTTRWTCATRRRTARRAWPRRWISTWRKYGVKGGRSE